MEEVTFKKFTLYEKEALQLEGTEDFKYLEEHKAPYPHKLIKNQYCMRAE